MRTPIQSPSAGPRQVVIADPMALGPPESRVCSITDAKMASRDDVARAAWAGFSFEQAGSLT